MEWQARSGSLAWSNPVVLVVGPADAGERRQYRRLVRAVSRASAPAGWRCGERVRRRDDAAVLCGLCFRLRLQVVSAARGRAADLLFDTWLSSVSGRPVVATVAEIALWRSGRFSCTSSGHDDGRDTTVNAAWVIVPLILIAECLSWYAVLTRNYSATPSKIRCGRCLLHRRVGLCRLLPEFDGAVRVALRDAIAALPASGVSDDDRRPDVPEALADREADGDKR
jgi:hypothetical protein